MEMLRRGGNAVDTAVAAGFAAAVVMPEMCGLGGDLFAVLHLPGQTQAPLAVLGAGTSPLGGTLDQMIAAGHRTASRDVKMPYRGALSVGVPGMVHALVETQQRFGRLSLGEVMGPAIRLADHGFPLTRLGAWAIAVSEPLLRLHPDAAAVFLKHGTAPVMGTILRQGDLANTLTRIVERGVAGFYEGPVAEHIHRTVKSAGGALSSEDLALHRTEFEPTIQTTYRGWKIHQTGLPSQGMILLEAMNIAECETSSFFADINADSVHMSAELLKLAYADRLAYACDPKFGTTPLESLLDKAWARHRYETIDRLRASETAMAGVLADGDTTYLCAADGEGGMVSLIQSVSSAFDSGLVAGETGVLLNNRVGRGFSLVEGDPNVYAPGKKTMNTLNCYMVADAGGEPVAVGGTPGGDGQPQWNLQVLMGLIDGDLDAQAAVEAPRWSIWPGTDPADRSNPFELRVETRVGSSTFDQLADLGHRVKATGDWNGGGGAQLIVRHPGTQGLAGGSDPRVEGFALGL